MRRTAVFLSVRFLVVLLGQHAADLLLCRKRAAKIPKGNSRHNSVLPKSVYDLVFLEE